MKTYIINCSVFMVAILFAVLFTVLTPMLYDVLPYTKYFINYISLSIILFISFIYVNYKSIQDVKISSSN